MANEKLIRHDIKLNEWANEKVRRLSKKKGIMQAILLQNMVLEHLNKGGE